MQQSNRSLLRSGLLVVAALWAVFAVAQVRRGLHGAGVEDDEGRGGYDQGEDEALLTRLFGGDEASAASWVASSAEGETDVATDAPGVPPHRSAARPLELPAGCERRAGSTVLVRVRRDKVPFSANRGQFVRPGGAGYRSSLVVPGLAATLNFPRSLLAALPSHDLDWPAFMRCAVVGNGGALLRTPHGQEIDEFDAVFRINYAPIRRYAAYSGTKTTFDLVNSQHAKAFLPEEQTASYGGRLPTSKRARVRNSTVVVFEVDNDFARQQLYAKLMRHFRVELQAPPPLILSPELVVAIHDLWDRLRFIMQSKHKRTDYKTKPMSGFFAAMLAAQMCNSVHTYGFSPWKGQKNSAIKYHYFDSTKAVLDSHSFDLAYEMFRLLAAQAGCDDTDVQFHVHV